MAIVNWGLSKLLILFMIGFMGFSKFWLIFLIIFLGGTIWQIFGILASLLIKLACNISPIKWMGTITISILALINGGYLGYILWTLKDKYSGWEIFGAIIATSLVFELTLALIYGSIEASDKQYSNIS